MDCISEFLKRKPIHYPVHRAKKKKVETNEKLLKDFCNVIKLWI